MKVLKPPSHGNPVVSGVHPNAPTPEPDFDSMKRTLLCSSTNSLMRDELAQVRKELAEAKKLLAAMEGWSNCVECGARRFDPEISSNPLPPKADT